MFCRTVLAHTLVEDRPSCELHSAPHTVCAAQPVIPCARQLTLLRGGVVAYNAAAQGRKVQAKKLSLKEGASKRLPERQGALRCAEAENRVRSNGAHQPEVSTLSAQRSAPLLIWIDESKEISAKDWKALYAVMRNTKDMQ